MNGCRISRSFNVVNLIFLSVLFLCTVRNAVFLLVSISHWAFPLAVNILVKAKNPSYSLTFFVCCCIPLSRSLSMVTWEQSCSAKIFRSYFRQYNVVATLLFSECKMMLEILCKMHTCAWPKQSIQHIYSFSFSQNVSFCQQVTEHFHSKKFATHSMRLFVE